MKVNTDSHVQLQQHSMVYQIKRIWIVNHWSCQDCIFSVADNDILNLLIRFPFVANRNTQCFYFHAMLILCG